MTKAGGVFTAMAAAAVLVAAIPSAARAADGFDGMWSVTIMTQAGNCPSSLRYSVRVAKGRVFGDDQKLRCQRVGGGERRNPRDRLRKRPIRQRHRPVVRQRGGGTMAHQHRRMLRPVDCSSAALANSDGASLSVVAARRGFLRMANCGQAC